MQDNNNKRALILSVLGVLVLIVAIVGISFAMYSFSATGTRQNVISTGKVSIDYTTGGTCLINNEYVDKTESECLAAGGDWYSAGNFVLTGEYPKTDARGINEASPVAFSVIADFSGSDIMIDYALKFVEVTESNLKAENVKLQIIKYVNGKEKYVMGSATSGSLLSTKKTSTARSDSAVASTVNVQDEAGNYYVFDEGTFSQQGSISYVVKAWVDENYILYSENGLVGSCSIDPTVNDDSVKCEVAGGVWIQEKSTLPQTLTFKIQVVGIQKIS